MINVRPDPWTFVTLRLIFSFPFQAKESSSESDSSDSDESPERKGGLQSANQLLEKLAKMKEFAEKKRREMVISFTFSVIQSIYYFCLLF